MVTKTKKKKKVSKKERITKNTGQVYFCQPLDVMKKMGAIKNIIDRSLPTIEILTFDNHFKGLKEDINKYINKGLRMNQLVMAIDKKFKAFETEEYFKNRLANIQRHLSIEIYTLIKGIRDRVSDEEINEYLEDTQKEIINSFLIPLMYYDHKVEISLVVDDVKVIFTFKDMFKFNYYKEGAETGCMYMITNKKELVTPLGNSVRNHSNISYRVVQSKQKLNDSDEPIIEAKLLFDGAPVIFGYYSI